MKSGMKRLLWRDCVTAGDALRLSVFVFILYWWVIPKMLPPLQTGLWKLLPDTTFMLVLSVFLLISMFNEAYLSILERYIARYGQNMPLFGRPALNLYGALKSMRIIHVLVAILCFYISRMSP